MNKKGNTIIWVIIIVVVVVVGWLLFRNQSGPVSTEPIKIGVQGPLTGEAASWGMNLSAGAQLAANEINVTGGINGRQIQLVIEDDKCDPKTAVNAMTKLVTVDKVVGVAGPICSSAAGPALPVAQQNNTPVLIISASAPGLTKIGDHIFRIYPSDAFQGKVGAEFVFNTLGKKKAAVIYVNNDWGVGIKDVFMNRFKELGGQVVLEDSVMQDSKDLRTQLAKVKSLGADSLYFPVYPNNAIGGLKQLKELGMSIPVVSGDAFSGEEVTGNPAADGAIYTVAKIANPNDFQQKVKSVPGYENLQVSMVASLGYDAIKIFAEVFKKVGIDDKKIIAALSQLKYDKGVSNPVIEFDANRDLKVAQFDIKLIKGGTSVDYVK